MPAIPLRGDRSAWNAASYQTLHANDVDASASSIHHTLGTSGCQAASGSHVHTLLSSGSSSAGQILTSLGSGSSTWLSLTNHSHSGSTSGDGGKLSWNNVWSDAIHAHTGSATGGKLSAVSSLTSGAAMVGYILTADGSGSVVWSPPSSTITRLDDVQDVHTPAPNDGDVLTWSTTTGSWIAFPALDWRVSLTQDETTDDSDKTIIVTSGREWQILWIYAEYTTTSTSGARQLEIQLLDISDNVIGQFQAGVTQIENLTYKYLFGIGVPDLTFPRDTNNVTTPLPAGTFLSQGQKIRIWDNNTVDPTADDMIIRMQYASRTLSISNYYVPTMRNSSHSSTSDNVTLIQNYGISTKSASQTQLSDNPLLSQRTNILSINNIAHTQTSENISSFSMAFSFTVFNGEQAQTSGNTVLTQYHILGMNNATQYQISENTTLDINVLHFYITSVQDVLQNQTSENVITTFYAGIIVQDSSQTQICDNTIIETDTKILSIIDSVQLQITSTISMTTDKATLGMKNSTQLQTSEKFKFTNMDTLTVNNISQLQTSGSPLSLTLNQKALAINNSNIKIISDSITLQNI